MRRNIHVLFAKIKGRRYAMRKEIEKARSLPLKDVSFFLPPDYPAELKATILGAGHERKRAGDDYDWHGNKRGPTELFIWQYTLAGRGMLSYGGRTTISCQATPCSSMRPKIGRASCRERV